jgi:predicted nuclease of predicted toxin-antitoxin system
VNDNPSSIKFYTDTHIAKAVATQLRNRGIDIIRCEEVGLADAKDEEHLEFATSQKRVLVSHDDDFVVLHHQWQAREKKHAGIMLLHNDLQGKIGTIVKSLLEYYELIEVGAGTVGEDIANLVTYIH